MHILVLARLCPNKKLRLATCDEVFATSLPEFSRRCFAHRQVVYESYIEAIA